MDTGCSSDHEQHSPSFFKVVRDPSAPHLSLPNAFVRRYLKKIPKNPTLKTVTGEHSWRLKIIKMGESLCFSHGWEKLVKDAQLCVRDILVFWLIDAFTFQVSFLGANGCEKDLPFSKTNDDDGDIVGDNVAHGYDNGDIVGDVHHDGDNVGHGYDNGEIVGDEDVDVGGYRHNNGDIVDKGDIVGDDHDDGECHAYDEVMPEQDICFQKAISEKTHRYQLTLPKKFVEAAGLEHKRSIKMKDHEGKEWRMGISVGHYGKTRHTISGGWFIFREYHKISDGDVCIFTFNKKEGVLNLAQLHKSKTPIKQETSMEGVNRNRGRQPLQGGGNVTIEDMWSPMEKSCGGVKVKTEYESGPEGKVEKRKRGRPPLKKPGSGGDGGGVNVKIEDELLPEVEELKRKRGRPPLEKPGGVGDGGGVSVKVKIEDESLPEVEELKRKRGRPPLMKPGEGGYVGVKVKIEDEALPVVEEVKRKRGRPPLGGGVAVRTEPETERWIGRKHVIYF